MHVDATIRQGDIAAYDIRRRLYASTNGVAPCKPNDSINANFRIVQVMIEKPSLYHLRRR